MRETAVFAWPMVALVLLWKGGPPRRYSIALSGGTALAFLLLEMVVGQLAFGDPWIRFKALTGAQLSQTTNPADLPYLNQTRLAYLEMIPRGMLGFADGWWMIAMAVLAVVGLVVFPRKLGLFGGWFVLVYVAFNGIGGVLRPSAPNIRLDVARYWIGFLPPMVMAAVGTVTVVVTLLAKRLGERQAGLGSGARRGLAVLVAVVLAAGPVVASAQMVRRTPTYVVVNGGVMSQLRNWMHAHDRQLGHRVLSDYASARILPVYERSFTGHRMSRMRFLAIDGKAKARPGDYVVLYSAHDLTCQFCYLATQAWLSKHPELPSRWHEVWHTRDRVFVVYRVPGKRAS
jgi:hypothetical protein